MRRAHLRHFPKTYRHFFGRTVPPQRALAEIVKVASICALKIPRALPDLKSGYV